jgi:polysaccharide pyruvyl transferase WcaK-like protein
MSKILLIGVYSSLNKGDFAMQQGIINGLLDMAQKKETIEIDILSQYPAQDNIRYLDYFNEEIADGRLKYEFKYNEFYNPLTNLYRNISSYSRLNNEWKKYDLVLDVSGDSIGEMYGFLVTFYHVMRLNFFSRENRLILAPQSVGPFTYSSNFFKNVFSKAERIYSRDPLTTKILDKIGVQSILSADLSFLLDAYSSDKNKTIITEIKNLRELYDSNLIIGLNCSFLIGTYMHCTKDAVFFIAKLIKTLNYNFKNCLFVFIPHVYGPIPFLDDREVIKQALPSIDAEIKEKMIIVDEELNHEEIKEIMKELDIVISARMHLCLGSLSVGTPFINLAYSQKSKGLFEDYLGLSKCFIDVRNQKNIDTLLDNITENLKAIIDKKEQIINVMLKKREEFSNKSMGFLKDLESASY